jgi:hypothetical protein
VVSLSFPQVKRQGDRAPAADRRTCRQIGQVQGIHVAGNLLCAHQVLGIPNFRRIVRRHSKFATETNTFAPPAPRSCDPALRRHGLQQVKHRDILRRRSVIR